MPSRSVKNRTRGNQRGTVPAPPKPSPGQLVSNYDGRANTNAGAYERKADGSAEPNGRTVDWKK